MHLNTIFMKKWLLAISSFVSTSFLFSQLTTVDIAQVIPDDVFDVKQSAIAAYDVNGDGKKDLFVSGVNSSGNVVNQFLLNNGYGTFINNAVIAANVTPLAGGSADFGIVSGTTIGLLISGVNAANEPKTLLYTYDGASLIASAQVFAGVKNGKAIFVDYNGDSNNDIVLMGENTSGTAIVHFYKNNGSGTFTEETLSVTPRKLGDFAFGDLKTTNATKELVVTGVSATNDTSSVIYEFNGSDFVSAFSNFDGYVNAKIILDKVSSTTLDDIFINGKIEGTGSILFDRYIMNSSGAVLNYGINELYYKGDFAIADFDGDGLKDYLYTGINSNGVSNSKIYLNDGAGRFEEAGNQFPMIYNGRILAFDFENDTDIDFIITGQAADGSSDTRLYRNKTICQSTPQGVDNINACGSYTWVDGTEYTVNNNTATFMMPNANIWGCDSIVRLNLVFQESRIADNRPAACDSMTWINGQVIRATTSGLEYVVGTNVSGCDSIRVLNVTIKNSSYVDYTISECNSYQWSNGNNQVYTSSQSNILFRLGQNAAGCDSIARLNLTINLPVERVDNVTACRNYTWTTGNGQTYSNNTSTETFIVGQASNGCDSIARLNLVISDILTGVDNRVACSPYTWIDGHTYYGNIQTVTHTTTSVNGCDSIVTLNLTMDTINRTLTFINSVPNVNQPNATYQWINCDLNVPVIGATGVSFLPWEAGTYACVISYRDCQDTTLCFHSEALSIGEIGLDKYVSIYPNPSKGQVTVKVASMFDWTSVSVYTVAGQLIQQPTMMDGLTNEFELSTLAKGVYIVKVQTNLGTVQQRLIVE